MKTKKYVANNGDEEFMNFFYNKDEKGWYEWEFTETEECKRIAERLAWVENEKYRLEREIERLNGRIAELTEEYNRELEREN